MSPIRSKKQWRYLASENPRIFERWQREQKRQYKSLPNRVKKRKKRKKR